MTLNYNKDKNSILWLWFPAGVFTALVAAELFLPPGAIGYIVQENGPLELLQFAILCLAFVLALLCLRAAKPQPGLMLWFTLAALGCLYTGGEEISWGQQFFKWATPDSWLSINDQQETNLHNTTSWLDQKPRMALEAGVVIGGLILPLLIRLRSALVPGWLQRIAPHGRMAVIALIFLTVKIFDKIGDVSDFVFFKRASEITEMYIYYFILIYLIDMRKRIAA